MEWISGIGRDSDGRLCVQAQGLDGATSAIELAEAEADLHLAQGRKLSRATVTLHTRRLGDTNQYLSGLGLDGLCTEGQAVYEFDSSIGVLVVPSQLLILATFGSQLPLRRELLAPLGPEALMTLLLTDGQLLLEKTPGRNRKENIGASMIRTRLEWLLTYPSARAAWGSIYRNALEGRFDSKPVRATAEVLPYGCLVGGKFLVTRLRVQKMTPDEEPHEFAHVAARSTFVFDTRLLATHVPGQGRPARVNKFLVSWNGELSDAQWGAIEPILETFKNSSPRGTRTRLYPQRALVNIMVSKAHGAQTSRVAKADAERRTNEAAIELFYRLKRKGYWAQITSALTQTESGSQV
jgi:hypothetical protein